MSWQCPYCENVNQDAVPICTVCERVAPVVESFLSLEQINHAREYEELLSEVYSSEASSDYENMLTAALKAASTFNQNDVAVSKIHLAVKLQYEKSLRDNLLENIKKQIEEGQYFDAQASIRLWHFFRFDNMLIVPFSEKVEKELAKLTRDKALKDEITQFIIDGNHSEALRVVETEILSNPDVPELKELRSKIQNIIKSTESTDKVRKIPKPPKREKDTKVIPTEKEGTTPTTLGCKHKKFPKVKRNK